MWYYHEIYAFNNSLLIGNLLKVIAGYMRPRTREGDKPHAPTFEIQAIHAIRKLTTQNFFDTKSIFYLPLSLYTNLNGSS